LVSVHAPLLNYRHIASNFFIFYLSIGLHRVREEKIKAVLAFDDRWPLASAPSLSRSPQNDNRQIDFCAYDSTRSKASRDDECTPLNTLPTRALLMIAGEGDMMLLTAMICRILTRSICTL